jgi:hypothetical protein
LDGFVEGRDGGAVGLSSDSFIAFIEAFAQAAESGAQLRCVSPVAGSAFRSLTGALERRKMISHAT